MSAQPNDDSFAGDAEMFATALFRALITINDLCSPLIDDQGELDHEYLQQSMEYTFMVTPDAFIDRAERVHRERKAAHARRKGTAQ